MNDVVDKYKQNLDWSIVISSITAAVLIGGAVYGMRKVGFTTGAKIVSGGK